MIPHRTLSHRAATVLFIAASFSLAAAAVGCGGDSSTTSPGPVALFTPDTPAPVAGTIALLAGSSSGASVNVRVTVTGVAGFFGAAFRIKYDPLALQFITMDNSTSFLRDGLLLDGVNPVTDLDVLFLEDHAINSGEIVVTATRKDPAIVGPFNVDGTLDLVVLNFVARKAIAAGAAEGRVDFGDPTQNQVCDGTVAAPGCSAVVLTLPWSGGRVSTQP